MSLRNKINMSKASIIKKVNYLVCVNNKNYSEVALKFACSMAEKNNGSVILLHVVEPVDYQSFGLVAEKMRKEYIEEAENLFKALAIKTNKWSGITPVLVIKEGMIEEQIIKMIEEDSSINMVILGSSDESSFKSRVLSVLVEEMGSKLDIPMLIVPGNLTNQQIKSLTE